MDIMDSMTVISVLAGLGIPALLLILGIIFVASHKRMAAAQEAAAKAQTELVKQLASISIELRHLTNDKN